MFKNGEKLNDNQEYQFEKELELIAEFSIKKDFFNIDSVAYILINCPTKIDSKEDYEDATITISDKNYYLEDENVKIRLRGNSTLHCPKKAYKLKFDEKLDIFGFGSDKEWALLANYFDPSHLRNYYAYKFAQALGLEYSVDCKFALVYLNNELLGLYLFTETIKTSKEGTMITRK